MIDRNVLVLRVLSLIPHDYTYEVGCRIREGTQRFGLNGVLRPIVVAVV